MNASRTIAGACLAALVLASGCSFAARSSDAYRDATRALLETKNADLESCYSAWLQKDSKTAGVVVVNFKIQPKTGKLTNIKADPAQTTAGKNLTRCVLRALDGLALVPGDEREADASFRWEFQTPG